MQSLDDHALLRTVAIESAEYRPEALEIARAELRRRGLEELDVSQYLTRFPADRVGGDGFCAECRIKTTDESPGNTITFNFLFGSRLIGCEQRCPVCRSVEQTLWLQVGLPLVPLGKYRVIYFRDGFLDSQYVGRKVQTPSAPIGSVPKSPGNQTEVHVADSRMPLWIAIAANALVSTFTLLQFLPVAADAGASSAPWLFWVLYCGVIGLICLSWVLLKWKRLRNKNWPKLTPSYWALTPVPLAALLDWLGRWVLRNAHSS